MRMLIIVFALALGACAQDYGGITKVNYDAQSGDIEYISGKEAVAYDIKFDRKANGDVIADVSASDVQAFKGQEIQAERIKAQTDAITGALEEMLPGIIERALCAAGIGTGC